MVCPRQYQRGIVVMPTELSFDVLHVSLALPSLTPLLNLSLFSPAPLPPSFSQLPTSASYPSFLPTLTLIPKDGVYRDRKPRIHSESTRSV